MDSSQSLSQSLVPAQSDDGVKKADVEEAKFTLKACVRNLRKGELKITQAGRPWKKESCKETLKVMGCPPWLNLEQWYTKYKSKLQKDVSPDLEIVDSVKKAYGTVLCWCLANFPDLKWYLHGRRKLAYAELLEAVIEVGNDAQSAAPTTKFPAPHDRPTQHLPSTLVAVEETPNQHRHGETIRTDGNPGSPQSSDIATACSEGQVSSGLQNPHKTSLSRHAKRPLVDWGDEIGGGHSGTNVSADETSQYPKVKRVRQAQNPAAEPVLEGLSAASLLAGDDQVVQANYLGPIGKTSAQSLQTMLIPCPASKVELHAWDTLFAIKFVLGMLGDPPVPKLRYHDYCYFQIPLRIEDLPILVEHMPGMKEWATNVENTLRPGSTEHIIVALPDSSFNDSFLAIRVRYDMQKSQSQSGPQKIVSPL